MVVERELAKDGKRRTDFTREDFTAKVWEQKQKSGGTIIGQLKRLGTSLDWSRNAFTMSGAPGAPAGEEGNFHDAVSEPLPSTVFLELLGLPVSRATEFIALKDGIIRPPASTPEERTEMVDAAGARIYAVLQEVVDEQLEAPEDCFISGFLQAEVDGERLTTDEVIDICYLFFLAGLDTVTASLDCMMARLATHPPERRRLADDPSVIPRAIEEMLRWETPVTAVVRITTEDTELSGCPIGANEIVSVVLGSANTDERTWEDADAVDVDRRVNKHLAFGGGVHRCLGSHLARMELRVVLEEWHARIPEYRIREGVELDYSPNLRQIADLPLVW
jgi:cytochrome P450